MAYRLCNWCDGILSKDSPVDCHKGCLVKRKHYKQKKGVKE
jgi:hypothetical protein